MHSNHTLFTMCTYARVGLPQHRAKNGHPLTRHWTELLRVERSARRAALATRPPNVASRCQVLRSRPAQVRATLCQPTTRPPKVSSRSVLRRSQRALLHDGHLDTLPLGQRNQRLGALANDKYVAQTSSEDMTSRVLDVNDVKAALVALTRDDDTDAASVLAAADHGKVASLKLDEIVHLARLQVELDGVVDGNQRVGVADRAAVVSHDVRNLLRAHLQRLDTAQLVLR
mmetsp:Transcript_41126/g.108648  ORF Transcript_41126/g.108648 Transcript_41126/m.108648 type:complete len:229 (-) Transcript_41126:569-1255(-)